MLLATLHLIFEFPVVKLFPLSQPFVQSVKLDRGPGKRLWVNPISVFRSDVDLRD
jgi:hypothetical protein